MTKKEWLSRARHIDKEIRAIEEEKLSMYEKATSTTASYNAMSAVQGASEPHKAEAYAIRAEELEREQKRLQAVKTEIQEAIFAMPDNDGILKTILFKYYVQCKTWEQIAVDIDYSWRQTVRKHGEALAKIKIPGIEKLS